MPVLTCAFSSNDADISAQLFVLNTFGKYVPLPSSDSTITPYISLSKVLLLPEIAVKGSRINDISILASASSSSALACFSARLSYKKLLRAIPGIFLIIAALDIAFVSQYPTHPWMSCGHLPRALLRCTVIKNPNVSPGISIVSSGCGSP